MLAELPTIVIVSDKTGSTCARVIEAALLQFDSPKVQIHWRTNVASPGEAESAAQSAAQQNGIIFYTVASAEIVGFHIVMNREGKFFS
jgi:regulator of PEP synthase PpsR (kinase-PPPase family)